MTIKEVQLDGPDGYLQTTDGNMHWLDGCDAMGLDWDIDEPPTHFKLEAVLGVASSALLEEVEELRSLPGAEYTENAAHKLVIFPLAALQPYLREFKQ